MSVTATMFSEPEWFDGNWNALNQIHLGYKRSGLVFTRWLFENEDIKSASCPTIELQVGHMVDSDPSIIPPLHVRRQLRHSIELRHQMAEIYRTADKPQKNQKREHKIAQGHAYFLSLLERTETRFRAAAMASGIDWEHDESRLEKASDSPILDGMTAQAPDASGDEETPVVGEGDSKSRRKKARRQAAAAKATATPHTITLDDESLNKFLLEHDPLFRYTSLLLEAQQGIAKLQELFLKSNERRKSGIVPVATVAVVLYNDIREKSNQLLALHNGKATFTEILAPGILSSFSLDTSHQHLELLKDLYNEFFSLTGQRTQHDKYQTAITTVGENADSLKVLDSEIAVDIDRSDKQLMYSMRKFFDKVYDFTTPTGYSGGDPIQAVPDTCWANVYWVICGCLQKVRKQRDEAKPFPVFANPFYQDMLRYCERKSYQGIVPLLFGLETLRAIESFTGVKSRTWCCCVRALSALVQDSCEMNRHMHLERELYELSPNPRYRIDPELYSDWADEYKLEPMAPTIWDLSLTIAGFLDRLLGLMHTRIMNPQVDQTVTRFVFLMVYLQMQEAEFSHPGLQCLIHHIWELSTGSRELPEELGKLQARWRLLLGDPSSVSRQYTKVKTALQDPMKSLLNSLSKSGLKLTDKLEKTLTAQAITQPVSIGEKAEIMVRMFETQLGSMFNPESLHTTACAVLRSRELDFFRVIGSSLILKKISKAKAQHVMNAYEQLISKAFRHPLAEVELLLPKLRVFEDGRMLTGETLDLFHIGGSVRIEGLKALRIIVEVGWQSNLYGLGPFQHKRRGDRGERVLVIAYV